MTPAVICIADTSTIPSRMPLFFTTSSTRWVMLMSSRFSRVSNHMYSVEDFMPERSYPFDFMRFHAGLSVRRVA